jgi:integrase
MSQLTDVAIRNAKPKDKPYKISNSGLYILIMPNGKKFFRWDYKFERKRKTLAIGQYPEISLKAALATLAKAKEKLTQGVAPKGMSNAGKRRNEARQVEGGENFENIALEWHERFLDQWQPNSAERILNYLQKDVFPHIGKRQIAEIKAPDVLMVLRRAESRGILHTAHRIRTVIGQVMRYGVATGRCERDPTGDLKGALPAFKTIHRAAVTDPAKVGPLLRMMDSYSGSFVVVCALRLLPMLFCRPGELRTMKWEDVDLEKAEWSYLVTKTQTPHIVPLSTQAVDILKELYFVTGNTPYVFPSQRSNNRPMSDMAINAAMKRMGVDTSQEITGHGWRAVARTILDEVLGFRPDFIEHQLAHTVRDPLGRAYNRTSHLPERKKMMQTWADYLDRLKAVAEIIPMKAAVG